MCYSYCSADFISILRISNALPFCQNILVIVTSFIRLVQKDVFQLYWSCDINLSYCICEWVHCKTDQVGILTPKCILFSFISPVTVCQSKSAIFCSMFFIDSTLVNLSISYQSSSNLFEDILPLKLLIRNKLFATTVVTCTLQVCCPA